MANTDPIFQEMNVGSFDDLIHEVKRIQSDTLNRVSKGMAKPTFLFRGQSDSSWPLESTLQRYTDQPGSNSEYSLKLYYESAIRIQSEIFTIFPQFRHLETSYEELCKWLKNNRNLIYHNQTIFAPNYLSFLRHYGFPSPLIDWTRSLYIAAFFAFISERPKSENVAIYLYIESIAHEGGSSNRSNIRTLGRFMTVDKRHILQQSDYTVCIKPNGDQSMFVDHAQAIQENGRGRQDIIYKFVLPASQRSIVCLELDQFNINAYWLFGNEESLMKKLASEQFEGK